ncbi:MAG: D-tyrosyl-tRNA(Tyr) deacylase [Nanoarchaeota archaeon]|nr:D-tyrosyl-tRNA(Tyr) deacylase [Nanoarchaeota archaeon]
MKPSIIVSTKDIAGMNIKGILTGLHGFRETTETFHGHPVHMKEGIKLYTIDSETIHSEGIDTEVEGDWIIFATRHKAASGQKSFSVHVPGNWEKAETGGKDRKLCTALPAVMKEAINKIANTYAGDEFEIIQECTHHGPYLEKPCMFIEIGSSEEEWKREDAGEVIAKVVNYIVMNPAKKSKSVIVLGGGHYNQVATKIMLNTEYAAGHICPKHLLNQLDERLLKQAAEKNGERFEMAVLDWKGLGAEKQRIVEMLDKLGIKHERWQRMSKEE